MSTRQDTPAADRRIGRYLLQEEIGRGGMGVVYAALDETLGRRVALKLLRPGGPDDDAALGDRFAQEMQIAVALEHPNIVPVHETGTEDGVRYIAMRLVPGEDLGAVIRREGALPPVRVARLGRQIASALDAAHARGLVHRDVKPGNVLLTGEGDEEHAYLTDFGLTREADGGLTQTGQWIGTVDYAAPEQIEAAPLSARTDVYALGCVFFHMLTGQLPFQGSFAAKATAHATAPLPPVGLPGALGEQVDRVLAVATAKDPERRQASAGALARALARIVDTVQESVTQRTAMMPALVGDAEDEAPTVVQAAPVAQARPRPRAAAVAIPAPPGPPPAGVAPAERRGPRPAVLVAVLAALVLAAGAIALVSSGGDDEPISRGSGSASSAREKASTSASTGQATPTTTAAKPATPPAAKIPAVAYSAPAGRYTAQVPAGEGWVNQGEQDLSGVIRTIFTGPDGQQLWIDATPTLAPSFGREGRTVTQTRRLDGPLGPIVGYRFTGAPAEFCAGGCVDYQLDLGGRGYAVIAGPTASARLAAKATILSLQETAPPPAPPAAEQPGKGNGKQGGKGKDEDEG